MFDIENRVREVGDAMDAFVEFLNGASVVG